MFFKIKEPLYPIVCSTAAKTEMTLTETRRDFVNLQDRCRAEIVKRIKKASDLEQLHQLPNLIKQYLADAIIDFTTIIPVDNYDTLKEL